LAEFIVQALKKWPWARILQSF